MSKCINVHSKEFQSLVEISGISSIELAAKMNLWMEDNNTDVWPSLSQLGLEGNGNFEIIGGKRFNPETGEGFTLILNYKKELKNDIPFENRDKLVLERFNKDKLTRDNAIEYYDNLYKDVDGRYNSDGNYEILDSNKEIKSTVYLKRYGFKTLQDLRESKKQKHLENYKSDDELLADAEKSTPLYETSDSSTIVYLNDDGSIQGSIGTVGIEIPKQVRGTGIGRDAYRAVADYLNTIGLSLKSDPIGMSKSAHGVWESLVKLGEARIIKGNSNDFNGDFYTAQYEFIEKSTESIKEGVDFVFEQNPELAKIGNEQQYSQYLETIFPDSKVKDIVYHDTNVKFDKFQSKKGIYFNLKKEFGFSNALYKVSAIINMENPIYSEMDKEHGGKNTKLLYPNNDSVIGYVEDKNNIGEYIVHTPEQIHILGSKQDIQGFKEFVKKSTESIEPISNTENIEDSYMADFGDDVNAKHEVSEFAESEFDFNDEIDNKEEPEFVFDEKDSLTDDEKKTGQNLSFAKLTQTLIYQHNDVNNELQNLYGKLKNAKKDERHIIKSNIAKTNQKRQELAEKIKQSKKLSNLEQVVEFGNDAYNEVLSILEAGNLTDKQLNYVDRITKFWIKAGRFDMSRDGHLLFGKDYGNQVPSEIVKDLRDIAAKFEDNIAGAVNSIERRFIVRMVKKQLSDQYTEEDIYEAIKDINWGEANLYSISDYSSPLLSAVYASMHEADTKSAWEFEEVIKQLEDKFKAADKFLTGKGESKYDLFYQVHNGQKTGDLVDVYSKAYLDKKAELILNAQKAKDSDKPAA